MNKKILTFTLTSIKYAGDSIGDDIRVEVDAFGKFLRIDKIIKAGATKEINQEIGKLETDQKLFKSGIRITVIEKDALFNDVGSINKVFDYDRLLRVISYQPYVAKTSQKVHSVLN